MQRSRLGAEHWQRLVAGQARSGLSVRAFAERHGVSPDTLTYWKYKRRGARPTRTTFAPVQVIDDGNMRGREFVLELDGVGVRIPPDFDADALVRLLAIVRRPC